MPGWGSNSIREIGEKLYASQLVRSTSWCVHTCILCCIVTCYIVEMLLEVCWGEWYVGRLE